MTDAQEDFFKSRDSNTVRGQVEFIQLFVKFVEKVFKLA